MTAPAVRCPTCQREVAWDESSAWRPFCSERCKLVDLGAWFTEGRSIAGEPLDPTSSGMADADTDAPGSGRR